MVFFSAAAILLHLRPPADESSTILREAVLGTMWGTVLQHSCSLFAHASYRASARLSHAVWHVDYAGILLNFIWNSPPIVFALAGPSVEWTWGLWRVFNVLVTLALLGGAAMLTYSQSIPKERDGEGVTFFALLFSSWFGIALLCLSAGLSLLATALVPLFGTVARRSGGAVIPALGLSLAIKIFQLPERWLNRDLSYSPLHSHSLWHLGVWVVQLCYYCFFSECLADRQQAALPANISSHAGCRGAEDPACWGGPMTFAVAAER